MELLFPRKIARLAYLIRSVALTIVIAVLLDRIESGTNSTSDLFAMVGVVAYWTIFVAAPRCRDLAMSAWFALLVFAPGVDLFFCGYLAWGRSKVRGESRVAEISSTRVSGNGDEPSSDALRQLEALRDNGAITEQDFVRRRSRLRRQEP